MRLNKEKFIEDIFRNRFQSSFTKCAKALNIELQHLHKYLTHPKSEAGAKLLGGFYVYCKMEGISFDDYIFLPIVKTGVATKTGTDSL